MVDPWAQDHSRYLTPEQYGQRILRLNAQDMADFQRLVKRYRGKS